MAEEVIVVEEGGEKEKKKGNKLFFILVIVLLVVVILLLVLLAVVVIKKKKEKNIDTEVQKITKKLEKKHLLKRDEIKELIKKANILYQKGEKDRALKILNKLSAYSEALSYYNLGVIKLKEKKYKEALNFFQKAIDNKENRLLSAINATYAALMMGDKKLFNYYKNLAYITLPEMSKSKSYPYYYAVVMYYMGYEWEALKALKNQNPYIKRSNQLKSAIYEYYNNYALAQELENNPFYKGLSLAEIGEYQLARRYLTLSKNPKAKFALGLVDLKLSLFKEASKYIKEPNYYPIRMYLKKSLFDVKVAQKDFAKTFLKTNKDFYDLFFYFAPYKVFNLNQTINFLKKGVAGIPIGAIKESKNYLYKSATSSALNIEISKALRLAINGHIYLSNKYFLKLLKKKPTSYILQYNLALTYAQMGDYAKAYEHFLRAYHLNPKDIYSGLYALMALDKLDKNNKYLLASIKEDLDKNSSLVLAVIQNNTVEMSRALEEKAISDPTILVARIASEMILGRDPQNDALILKNMYPKDIVANILYFYSTHLNEPVNRIALDFQALFFGKDWSMNEFYYGSFLAREWLFKFAKISGLLNSLREEILIKAKEETFDLIPVLKRLAFANLYTKHFEEAYVIYNDLINNKNISDPATLYNAAVAAVGANHHANAVALMELAKLKNPSYYEARYGLGLLWQEANNLRAAKIQYIRIPDGFKSKFFDFNIAKKE